MPMIYVLDECPVKAAMDLCDKHVKRQIVSVAATLGTAHIIHRKYETPNNTIYWKSYKHPNIQWAAYSVDNYEWLYEHWSAICQEYVYRFEQVPPIMRSRFVLRDVPDAMYDYTSRYTDPPQVVPEYCKSDTPVEAYRMHYLVDVNPSWEICNPPRWYNA